MENHYSILGLHQSATLSDIKAAYRKLALKYHPDRNQGNSKYEDIFKRITSSYEVLSDPERRRQYDSQRDFITHHSFNKENVYQEKHFTSNKPYDFINNLSKYKRTITVLLVLIILYAYSEYKTRISIISGVKETYQPDDYSKNGSPVDSTGEINFK